jgi:hypothetical protein
MLSVTLVCQCPNPEGENQMAVTRNDARKLIKTHAPTKYSNSVVLLLLRIVDLTYRKDKDNAEHFVETPAASLMRSAAIGDKQLGRIFDQLSDDDVLQNIERRAGRVSCRLNLEPLKELEPYGDKQRAEKKANDAARSQKAREKRTAIREFNEMDAKVGNALNADLCEKTLKEALLKDVKDQNIRRMMMNWDVDRIARAKRNAERILSGVA